MYAESGLKADITNSIGATGLIQFLPKTADSLGTTTDIIKRTDEVGQLKFVDKYLSNFPLVKGGGVYEIYAAIFFPLALKYLKDPNWIIESSDLSAYNISKSNPGIACRAGKKPGEPLTITDFKKYVDCIT